MCMCVLPEAVGENDQGLCCDVVFQPPNTLELLRNICGLWVNLEFEKRWNQCGNSVQWGKKGNRGVLVIFSPCLLGFKKGRVSLSGRKKS